ncbi:MAG: hypothetical protein ACK5MR_14280 [Cumulibacter sp.]
MSTSGQRGKVFTAPILVALAAVVVLAVVTVIVVMSGDGDDLNAAPGGTSGNSAPASSEQSSSSSASSSEPTEIVNDEFDISYSYPTAGYEPSMWAGPLDMPAGSMSLLSATTYEACTPEAGADVLFAFVTSDESDLAEAAQYCR